MVPCSNCGCNLLHQHSLYDMRILPMTNGVNIITPVCKNCGARIHVSNIEDSISPMQRLILLSGTCASGKSTLGKYIERFFPYIFVDGDAISKRVNYEIRNGLTEKRSGEFCHEETIDTALILLGLGYHVLISYVIDPPDLKHYLKRFHKYQIYPAFRALIPRRNICLQRNFARTCWTAEEAMVNRWYESQASYLDLMPEACIDNSDETAAETVAFHFQEIL